MRKFLFLLTIGSSLFLGSCGGSSVYNEEIATADSLITVVENMLTKMDSVSGEMIITISKESGELNTYLSENYPDTSARDFWVNEMNTLYSVKRATEKFLGQEKKLRKELSYSKMQLETFINSLKDERLSPEDVKKYLDIEMDVVKNMQFVLGKIYPQGKYAISKWKTLKPRLQSIADSIKAL